MDNLSQEGHDNNGGKIDDCLKENHLDCKEVSENGMLRFDNTKESDNLSATEVVGFVLSSFYILCVCVLYIIHALFEEPFFFFANLVYIFYWGF